SSAPSPWSESGHASVCSTLGWSTSWTTRFASISSGDDALNFVVRVPVRDGDELSVGFTADAAARARVDVVGLAASGASVTAACWCGLTRSGATRRRQRAIDLAR